jgi:23S rRNA U2552 (ribose-2'-O)-methylase RlmE/FtsJ
MPPKKNIKNKLPDTPNSLTPSSLNPNDLSSTDKSSTEKSNTDKSNTDKSNTDKSNSDKSNTEKSNSEKSNTEKSNTEKSNSEKSNTDKIPKITDMDYLPIVVDISMEKNDSFYSLDPNVELTVGNDYPKFTLGFHHHIHSNKNKMEIIKQFKDKKKIYLVVNKFERYIDNYEQNIGNHSNEFFELKTKIKNGPPNILSRGFYKLWEILFMFDLIQLNEKNFISAHLAEGPGSFIQATMFFRDKFCKNGIQKNDKYHAITLHPEDEKEHVPKLEQSFIDYYDSEKPKRFLLHKTYSKQVAGGMKDKDNGDLCDPKTINLFGGQIEANGGKVHFITADGGFNWKNENTQEQEAFRLIFAQILAAVKIQNKGGNFVCKFFETFTDTSAMLIYVLTQFYDKVFIVKPLTSRPSNSEKYAVCMGFKFKDTDKHYVSLFKSLTFIHDLLHKNKTLNITKLWNFSYNVPDSFKINMIHLNKTIANKQLKSINEITQFITSQNYYGDSYSMYRQMQIDASKYWNKVFMPQNEDFEEMLEYCRTSTTRVIDKTKQIVGKVKYH